VQACTGKPFTHLSQFVDGQTQPISGCICVLLDWDEPRQAMVASLRDRGISLLVLLITEPGVPAPEPGVLSNEPGSFKVLESGKIAEGLRSL
jgi:hypothetical protein